MRTPNFEFDFCNSTYFSLKGKKLMLEKKELFTHTKKYNSTDIFTKFPKILSAQI